MNTTDDTIKYNNRIIDEFLFNKIPLIESRSNADERSDTLGGLYAIFDKKFTMKDLSEVQKNLFAILVLYYKIELVLNHVDDMYEDDENGFPAVLDLIPQLVEDEMTFKQMQWRIIYHKLFPDEDIDAGYAKLDVEALLTAKQELGEFYTFEQTT